MNIIYQDEMIVVCEKQPGVLSQAGKSGEETMLTLLKEETGDTVFPIHRLDREVGGVMVYAKTKSAAAVMSQAMQQGRFRKEYLAVLRGCPHPPEGIMEDLLLHDRQKNKSYVVDRIRKGVKPAKLAYTVLEGSDTKSLVQVRLFTGRTHQIRVQFSSRQMPLLGDGRYGGGSGTIALWSVRLSFPHPADGKQMTFFLLPAALGGYTVFPPLENMA